MSVTTQIIFPYMSDAHAPAMDIRMSPQDTAMALSFWQNLRSILIEADGYMKIMYQYSSTGIPEGPCELTRGLNSDLSAEPRRTHVRLVSITNTRIHAGALHIDAGPPDAHARARARRTAWHHSHHGVRRRVQRVARHQGRAGL